MESLRASADTLFILLGAIMVLAMHAGFAFLELGTVRKKNQVNALVKILTDFALSTIAYFFIGYRALGRVLLGPWTRVFREGFVAGLLGAAAVAIWFLIVDTAAGMPLRTPALLGAAMLEGLRDPGALVITWPLVIKYTLIHGGAFLLFGWLLAGLLTLADREPRLLYAIIMLFCCFEVFFIAIIAITAEWLFEALAWWNILAGNVLAALVMLAYFFRGHRVTWREFITATRES